MLQPVKLLIATALIPFFSFQLVLSAQKQPAESKERASSNADKLAELVDKPDRETYLALRKEVIASKSFKPYSDELDQANDLYADGKTKEARDLLLKSMDNLLLNPRAHARLSFYQAKLGDDKAAKREMQIADACLKGILATGDGTKEKPYLVLRVDDEYEVISRLQKRVKSQSLRGDGDRTFDVINCADDSLIYFDITDFFGKF